MHLIVPKATICCTLHVLGLLQQEVHSSSQTTVILYQTLQIECWRELLLEI